MPFAFEGWHTLTLRNDGSVLVVGEQHAALYDPQSETWSVAPTPAISRVAHAAILLDDGSVLVVGGMPVNVTRPAEVFTPQGTWASAGTMAVGRLDFGTALLRDGRVLVIGGRTEASIEPIASAEVWSPTPGSEPEPCDPERDLTGLTKRDGTTGWVTNASSSCFYQAGMASYSRYDAVIDHQQLFASTTMVIPPHAVTKSLHVAVPACSAQIDLFYGDVLTSTYGQRYGTRLLHARVIAGPYCEYEP
jgi:hypothetical protein